MSQSRLRSKFRYFMRSTVGNLQPARRACPECGSDRRQVIHRKLFVTQLNRCSNCQLLYRTPTDPPDLAQRFYQQEYRSGATTDLPSMDQLATLMETRFLGTEKDFAQRIEILKCFGMIPGKHRIFDFGCSWGYGTWQLQQAGFETVGLEISRPRASFGRDKLGVTIIESPDDLDGRFDVFFSAHVVEHLSAPRLSADVAKRTLNSEGLFVSFTPNGCEERMDRNPASYHRSWGAVHPSYLDHRYWFQLFGEQPKLVTSDPYDLSSLKAWDQASDCQMHLTGSELLFVAKI